MPKAIGYCRVSTDKQADSGLGLEAQEKAISAAATRLGLALGPMHTDAGISGAAELADRPGLMDAIADLRRGDTLIVAKRDRLGRDVIAVAMIERMVVKAKARIVSAAGEGTESDDPTGQLMRRIVDAFGEYERLLIGARTKAALKAKRARGERFSGRVPFGYRLAADGRQIEPEAAEQAILAVVRDCRQAGFSQRAIADELNRQGFSTRSGVRWQHQYVANVLRQLAA